MKSIIKILLKIPLYVIGFPLIFVRHTLSNIERLLIILEEMIDTW